MYMCCVILHACVYAFLVCLSVFLSVSLSVPLPLRLSVSLSLCVCMYICVCVSKIMNNGPTCLQIRNTFMSICVCFVYMYALPHLLVFLHALYTCITYIKAHTHLYIHTYNTYINTHIFAHAHIHMHTYIHTYTHTVLSKALPLIATTATLIVISRGNTYTEDLQGVCTCIDICMYVCLHSCMYVCMYTHA